MKPRLNILMGMAAIVALSFVCSLARGDYEEYRYYFRISLDPMVYPDSLRDDNIVAPGSGVIEETTGTGLWGMSMIAGKDEGSGNASMYFYMPKLRANPDSQHPGDVVEGSFYVKQLNDWYGSLDPVGNGVLTTLHLLKAENGTGFRIRAKHQGDWSPKLVFEILKLQSGSVVVANSYECDAHDLTTWHRIYYKINLSQSTGTDNVVFTLYNVTLSPSYSETQAYTTSKNWRTVYDAAGTNYWTRAVYGLIATSSQAYIEAWNMDDAWLTGGIDEHVATIDDDPIDPLASPPSSQFTWALSTSCDPYLYATDPQLDPNNNETVAEKTSGLRGGTVWNYGLDSSKVASTSGERRACVEQSIPGIRVYDEDWDPHNPTGKIEGSVHIKMAGTNIPSADAVTRLVELRDLNSAGIRFCMKHDGLGKAYLRLEATKLSGGSIIVDRSAESTTSTDFTLDWYTLSYTMTLDLHNGWTLDAEIRDSNNNLKQSVELTNLDKYNRICNPLRLLDYGIRTSNSEAEKWFIDDGKIAIGWVDGTP